MRSGLVLAVLLGTAALSHGSSVDFKGAPDPSESLLHSASLLQKAEAADCGSVKHLANANDKCQFVKEHCAGGASLLATALVIEAWLCPRFSLLSAQGTRFDMEKLQGHASAELLCHMCRLHYFLCGDILLQYQACGRYRQMLVPGTALS